ncbi:hypothetical protein NKW51_10700, partial [Acetobacter lambici]|nr:hypothetical protein [Acetobacter lambici]
MDRLIQYPAQIPLVEDMLNAQRNAMVGIGHLAGAAFGANTVAAAGFSCTPGEGLALTLAPGALLAPGVVDASAYGTLAAVSSALVRQFISRDPVTLAVPAAGATYIVHVSPQTVDTDDTVLPFYNAADPSVTYAGENNSGLSAPTVRRDEAVLDIGAVVPDGAYPLWQVAVPAGATAITADMIAIASGAPFYPSLSAVAPRIVAPFNAQLAAALGGYPLNAVVADPATPGAFWVSTADANVSTPGADGATWQSLFNGYATQTWANGQFLQLALATLQSVTGPVAFGGQTTVPDVALFNGKDALNAETAEGRYVRSIAVSGQARIADLVQDADGRTLSNGAVLANLADIPIPLDQKIQYFTATHTSPGGHTVQFPIVFPEAFSSSNIMVIGIAFGENTTNNPLLLPNIEPGTETSTGLSFRMAGIQASGTFDPPA